MQDTKQKLIKLLRSSKASPTFYTECSNSSISCVGAAAHQQAPLSLHPFALSANMRTIRERAVMSANQHAIRPHRSAVALEFANRQQNVNNPHLSAGAAGTAPPLQKKRLSGHKALLPPVCVPQEESALGSPPAPMPVRLKALAVASASNLSPRASRRSDVSCPSHISNMLTMGPRLPVATMYVAFSSGMSWR